MFLEKHADDLNTVKTLLKLALFLAIPIGLIFVEPDLSTTLCICATLFIVIFIAGLSLKIIGIAVLCSFRVLVDSLVYTAGQPPTDTE